MGEELQEWKKQNKEGRTERERADPQLKTPEEQLEQGETETERESRT